MADARIVGRFLAVVADTADDADTSPDHVPLGGTITLTPSVSSILRTQPEPATFVMTPIVATLDSTGYLSHLGSRGISVLAPDATTNPTSWTYKVTPTLTLNGKLVQYPSWNIEVSPGATVDLALEAPVPAVTGTPITRGVGVQKARNVNGALVLTLTDGNDLPAVPLPAGPMGPQGDGVRAIETIPATSPPGVFPTGISVMQADNGGYPAQFATVETVRYGLNRSFQTVVERTTGRSWRRTPDASDAGWLPWVEWGKEGAKGNTGDTGPMPPGLKRSALYTLGQNVTVKIPDTDCPRQGPVFVVATGDASPGPLWMQVYRNGGSYNTVERWAGSNQWTLAPLQSQVEPTTGTFRIWVDGTTSGAFLCFKSTNNWNRQVRLYWFDTAN